MSRRRAKEAKRTAALYKKDGFGTWLTRLK